MLKKVRYFIEGILVRIAYRVFGRMSFAQASDTGGVIFRKLGPFLSRTRVARSNLRQAMPELQDEQIENIIHDMWENMGRFFAEFPHLRDMSLEDASEILEIEGLQHIHAVRDMDKGSIFVSGHIGNWELACRALALHGFPHLIVYRKGNNPILDKIIQQTRNTYQLAGIAKGKAGARQLVQAIRERNHVGVLIDQKMNDGIPVKFFGRDAMTGPAIARIALRFGCPVIMGRVVRTQGHRLKLIIYPPVEIHGSGDQEADVLEIMTNINATLEGWIREYPSQWIWIHNRWPKS